ncbi:MAG: hypothetical protein JST63_04735 [Bacteroidetes bacterium]|nr:hypothetical protein [Bacteroidota bacterium]
MKKIVAVIIFSAIYTAALCQQCASYFFESQKMEWFHYNARGMQDGTIIFTVLPQSVKNKSGNASINFQLFDVNQKLLNTDNYSVKCLGQHINVDMRFYLPAQQVEQYMTPASKMKLAFLEYPLSLKKGDQLKDGYFRVENDENELKQILQMSISKRTVNGMEHVTTPAGDWDCFKITYTLSLKLQTGPITIPLSMEMTEWYAPSFGVVKKSSAEGYTEINSIN